jgi:predicted small lipoprotein YifL
VIVLKKIAVLILALALIAMAGCGKKENKPVDNHPAKVVKESASLEQLQTDLKNVQSLYIELEDAFKANKDSSSWGQFSSAWNKKRQTVFDKIKAAYPPSTDPKDINYQGGNLLGASANLMILWQEYTNSLSGKPANPDHFKAEFQQSITEVEQFIKGKQ